jgi:sortase A
MWKKAAYLLVIAGLVLMIWPKAREWVDDYKQHKLLEDARASLADASAPPSREASYEQLSQLFAQAAGEDASPSPSGEPESSPVQVTGSPGMERPPKGAIAILRIAKIDLELPVLEGATQANMKVGAAHMSETSPLGEIGNAAIAAHRAFTKGRLFNRLNEVEVGDTLELERKGETEEYKVYRVVRVLPTDLSVLEGNGKDRMITLITCDPMDTATHRLIVQAKPISG